MRKLMPISFLLCGGCVEGIVTDAIWTAVTVNAVNWATAWMQSLI